MSEKFRTLEDKTSLIVGDILEKNPKPVYFLQGEESFYINLIGDSILENVLEKNEKSFNTTIVYASETNISEIILVAKRYPMMAKYQIIVVKEAQYLKDLTNKSSQEKLIKYIDNPNKTTILCFLFKDKKLPATSRLVKKFKASSNVVYFESDFLVDWEVSKWVIYYLKKHQKKISLENATLVADYVGKSRTQLSTELQKVILNIGQADISKEDISRYIGISKIYNVFELQNAILLGQTVIVIKIVTFFSKNPKNYSVQNIVENLYRMLTQLMIALKFKNENSYTLSQKMKLPPFLVEKYYIPARKFYSFGGVVKGLRNLARLDRQIKGIESTSLSHGELLELYVSKLMLK